MSAEMVAEIQGAILAKVDCMTEQMLQFADTR